MHPRIHAQTPPNDNPVRAQSDGCSNTGRDLCKIPFPHDNRNPNTGFRLFSPQIPPNFTQT
nr:hypothetical protein [Neisseria meningitidis]